MGGWSGGDLSPYLKCPLSELFSARIPCGLMADVPVGFGTKCPMTSAKKQKKISEIESGRPLNLETDIFMQAADICWTFCSNTPHPLDVPCILSRHLLKCLSDVR